MIYTTSEIAKYFNVTTRTITGYCRTLNVPKLKGVYQINDEVKKSLETLINTPTEKERKGKEAEIDTITETFNKDEYDKLLEVVNNHKILLERIEDYKNEIQYLRKSLDNKDLQMNVLIENINKSIQAIQQGNYLLNDKSKS